MKSFNTAGKCIPSMHYMVDISRQVESAAMLVRDGKYFCINRGRQYGKTTTLAELKKKLEGEGYAVFSLSFEGMDDSSFLGLNTVLFSFVRKINDCILWDEIHNLSDDSKESLRKLEENCNSKTDAILFSRTISLICKTEKIVLIIDEVDQAGNYQSFLQFLGLIRDMYLKRDGRPTFKSVILAGVYDVKNLKLKVRSEDEHQYNSPWNISVAFNTDMSLPAEGIAEMLNEYKIDHNLCFDSPYVGQMIHDYTSGYPFLVSRLCEIIEAEGYTWNKEGVLKATHDLLVERNTLFDDMVKKLDEYSELKDLLRTILFEGKSRTFYTDEKYLQIGLMFNFLKNDNGNVGIACRLMETRLYNMFIGENETSRIFSLGQMEKNQFIHDGIIDMKHLLERFIVHFNEIYRPEKDDEFVEENGRKIFLTYLRPIINGVGNYYCEARTRDLTRTDIIIDYLGQQYVIELKIWRGEAYNERGVKQLSDYLDYYRLHTGYMVSFCFNKNKQSGIKEVVLGEHKLIEAVV